MLVPQSVRVPTDRIPGLFGEIGRRFRLCGQVEVEALMPLATARTLPRDQTPPRLCELAAHAPGIWTAASGEAMRRRGVRDFSLDGLPGDFSKDGIKRAA